MFFFLKLKIREKHSDCNLTNLTYSYHFRSKSETTTDLISFANIRQLFQITKKFMLKNYKLYHQGFFIAILYLLSFLKRNVFDT